MKQAVQHEMIMASAGSGKTYALVNRYLRLLSLEVSPARINALTFTRKAAGEFLQQILMRLVRAAGSEEAADKLSEDIQLPGKDSAFFRKLLKDLVQELGRLQLGTIDSFFARLLNAFPYELGLTRAHRIMDEIEQNVARRLAMEQLLAGGDEERENRVLQMYKQLTWGVEGKSVYRIFEDHLKNYHDLFLEDRSEILWGHPGTIFGKEPWWLSKEEDVGKLLDSIEKELGTLGLRASTAKGFATLLNQFRQWQPGLDVIKSKLWESLLAVREDLQAGHAEVTFSRVTLQIDEPLSGLLYQLVQTFIREEILRKIGITQSIGQLLAEYDMLYDRSVREAGSLVFADFPMLLIKGLCTGNPVFDASDIIYRLDGQTEHWMIDEFQDTSRIQWKVLETFVDEVLQDASGERSFFYVGDVKQSIYGWRGGDARLFGEIYEHYNQGEPGIQKSVLNRSWRSVPPVLDCVNTLFGDALTEELIGKAARKRWETSWANHVPSPVTEKLSGYAAWGLVEDKEALARGCIEVIEKVDPLSRDLSCAVLVRSNAEVAALTQQLREAGIPASMEGVVRIAFDNSAGTWILAFLYSLARPDEAFPRAYLQLQGLPIDEKEYRRLAGLVRSLLTEQGYAEAIRQLLAFLEPIIKPDAFLRRRAEQLLEAATRFESTAMEGLETFIRYLEESTVKEASLATQVQVMTIHKAKGLGFDVVLVAGFGESPVIGQKQQSLHVSRNPDGQIDWILDLPRKQVLEQDYTLQTAHADYTDDQMFEAMCLLYVAMTRAKRGLYCIAPEPSVNRSTLTWHKLFAATMDTEKDAREEGHIRWQSEFGDPAWSETAEVPEKKEKPTLRLDAIRGKLPQRKPMLRRIASPSQEAHGEDMEPRKLRSTAGRQFGTRMHDFLATVEWIDFGNEDERSGLLKEADHDIAERLAKLLQTDASKEIFNRPEQRCALWREKPYALRKGDSVAMGIIDRAVVYLDAAGQPERIIIYDYKTDALEPDKDPMQQLMDRYATQLERYREAASVLTGLAEEKIETRLVPV
ncbi:MAG: UvrD-helicase domain-containing protein [Puniceicoccaceae bacterium]